MSPTLLEWGGKRLKRQPFFQSQWDCACHSSKLSSKARLNCSFRQQRTEFVLCCALTPPPPLPGGFSFKTDGDNKIEFDPAGVYAVKPNLKGAEIPANSPARPLAEEFNKQYTKMLSELHRAFNGEKS